MSKATTYQPGGDAQAIKRIADSHYGGYKNMFEKHGWEERGNKMMPAVQARVVDAYGSVRAFEEEHQRGDLMFPMEAITSDRPNVWLTSLYGFRPEAWGFLGFSQETMRDSFVNRSNAGVLVVIYGGPKATKAEQGKIIGIQQCSNQTGMARDFMSPVAWTKKEHDPESADKWNYAVKVTRAWRVTPETAISVGEFAPTTYTPGRGQAIGSWGMPLIPQEALNILKLDLQEVDVYGQTPLVGSVPGTAKEILLPSKAGPVSATSFVTRESEGPKHLYILKLHGDTEAFLGEPGEGRIIVKVGFSRSPQTRCDDHNRTLPKCAFKWDMLYSGHSSGYEPYPSSNHAIAGENAMKEMLCKPSHGQSLGGEFFLAELDAIEEAWQKGNLKAKDYNNE